MSTVAQRVQLGPFFDQGELCTAALLEHYEVGSSTIKDIWSDALMTTPLPNPFTSDARGIFNFFADGYYKIIIKTADNVVLYTLDNWKFVDVGQPEISIGSSVPTASSMQLSDATWAHWTGSVNVAALSGTSIFYWAIADGNFTLLNSSNLIMPDARSRKVLAGDVLFWLNEGAGVWRLSGHMQKEGGWTGRQGASNAATATLAVPTDGDFVDVSGATTITAVATASAGYRFRARFTGTGLNITHNATSLISPWGRDYRTIPNEIIEFQSLGSGNWIFYSINGPKERVGTVITHDGPTMPPGFLARDGTAYLRSDYPGLFAELGSGAFYGSGDGSTTFNTLDSRGRFDLHIDGSANRVTSASLGGANADALSGTGGEQTHTLTLSETPANSVNYTAVRNVAGAIVAAGSDKGEQTNSLNVGGSGGAHNNMPPWLASYKYIRF